MTTVRHILIATFVMSMTGGLWGCNTTGCLENRSSIPKAGFYDYEDRQISLDSISIVGIGADSGEPINKLGISISSISLPMRSTKESTAWEFGYKWKYLADGTLADTISFDYESMPYFASEECGVIYRYRIKEMRYTTHLVDSIILMDSLITNIDTEQIKIYFRTQSTDES